MFNFKQIIFFAVGFVIFYICLKYVRRYYDLSQLKWKKLFLEFYIVSFLFFITSLGLGAVFGVRIFKDTFLLFGVLFLVIIPAITYSLYYLYGNLLVAKKTFGIEYLLVFNRLCELLLVIHILASL